MPRDTPENGQTRWKLVGWSILTIFLMGLFVIPGKDVELKKKMKEEVLRPFGENKIDRSNIFRVYFVAGILHGDMNSRKLIEDLKSELSGPSKAEVEIKVFDDIFYVHSEHQKMETIVLNIKKQLEEDYNSPSRGNKKIVILAHSWGGILAKTAIHRFLLEAKNNYSENEYGNLKKSIVLITLATPHTLTYGSANVAKINLATPDNLEDIKIFTFGGIFDVVVPAKFAYIEKNKKIAPNTFAREVRATHMMFLNSPRIHREVFKNIFK